MAIEVSAGVWGRAENRGQNNGVCWIERDLGFELGNWETLLVSGKAVSNRQGL
jgi:hypothetical protein